jgi:methylphosphotriester-DNA--protein-cysteine methyltransferase
MIYHADIDSHELWRKIKRKEIIFAGNKRLKIYGTLQCRSGKRMNKANRVFFKSEKESIENNFRPCGHCLQSKYHKWKDGIA